MREYFKSMWDWAHHGRGWQQIVVVCLVIQFALQIRNIIKQREHARQHEQSEQLTREIITILETINNK